MSSNVNFAIAGGVVAAIVAIAVIGIVSSDEQYVPSTDTRQVMTDDIQKRLDEIKNTTQIHQGRDTQYNPDRPHPWQKSGPFQIDRHEYALGENVFFRADGIQPHEKGQIAFLRPLNDTHYSVYLTFSFDGKGPPFNRYFTPDLSLSRGICDIGDLAGEWQVVFRGTDYDNLEFTVSDSLVVPGKESQFEPVC